MDGVTRQLPQISDRISGRTSITVAVGVIERLPKSIYVEFAGTAVRAYLPRSVVRWVNSGDDWTDFSTPCPAGVRFMPQNFLIPAWLYRKIQEAGIPSAAVVAQA